MRCKLVELPIPYAFPAFFLAGASWPCVYLVFDGELPLVPEFYHFMRGQKVFKEIIKESGLHSAIRKGRSNSLLFKRNECMVARYYYYGSMKNKVYEETLRLLVSEFFLSPSTIAFQVQEHTEQLQSLKRSAPALYYFQNRWPHLKW